MIPIQLLRTSLKWIPTQWKATLEFYFDKSADADTGGAFNLQEHRKRIFSDLMERVPVTTIVETGTFRGSTTQFMAQRSDVPIHTVEAFDRFYYFARHRLKTLPQVTQHLGDSRVALNRLAKDPKAPKQSVFFYLDAHWKEDLPLREELVIITKHWNDSIVMIDDFEVPDDKGYEFDDYGDGKKLCLEYLGDLSHYGMTAFFPSIRGEAETGRKRGCVVLSSEKHLPVLRNIPSLREWSTGNGYG